MSTKRRTRKKGKWESGRWYHWRVRRSPHSGSGLIDVVLLMDSHFSSERIKSHQPPRHDRLAFNNWKTDLSIRKIRVHSRHADGYLPNPRWASDQRDGPVSGAKNAALPLMSATLLTEQPICFVGAPTRLVDVQTMGRLLVSLGTEFA